MIEDYVSPSELRRLVSALAVVLGFIAIAVLFAFLMIPGQRYQAKTSDEVAVVAVQGESGWLDATDYPAAKRQEIPPIDPATVMTPNPELLARGRELYTKTCETCHGPTGEGNGPAASGLSPRPRDFTQPTGWKNGTRVEDIYRTLNEGIKGSSMTSYSYLRRRDQMALVHYVQSLGSFDHGTSEPSARAALVNVFANSGEVIPNRIPVRQAIDHLIAEYVAPRALNTCPVEAGVRGAVADPTRAARVMQAAIGDDTATFARRAALGAPHNGYSTKVDAYSRAEWDRLRSCFKSE